MEDLMKITTPKMKQTTLNKFFSPPTDQLGRCKIEQGSWLNTKNYVPYSKESFSKKKSLNKKNNKSLKKSKNVTGNTESAEYWKGLQAAFPTCGQSSSDKLNIDTKKKKTDNILLTRSESFETYGMVLPTADKIIENINKIRKEAKALDDYEQLYIEEDSISEVPNDLGIINTSPIKDSLLDCKHLSLKKLKWYFENNLDYIKDIKNGVQSSRRHEIYQHLSERNKLTYNTSTIVFSSDQIEYLLSKLEISIDPYGVNTEYIMMVLLPELCLRIFMDVHKITFDEAVEYLEWRPVD
ncbi:hypothetical protein WA026_003290 [Henosepilachna vigintioctopunctata]|uniref:Uncharacterized protein n=1 Tax=Henosepilachna vigintioctopunctata TaxID=420089 RepID=A0AAW1TQW4_9CUCU